MPARVAAIVEQALEKDVTQRFFDAAEFAYALESFAFTRGPAHRDRAMKEFLHTRLGSAPADASQVEAEQRQRQYPGTSRRSRSSSGSGLRPTVAILPLQGCFGCQVNMLDLHERLSDLLKHVDVQFSHLADIKEVPELDIGLVEGAWPTRRTRRG